MTVHVDDRGAVRMLTLDRPDVLNAFDSAQYDRLAGALAAASADDAVSVVVLTGEGRAFSTGQDLREMASLQPGSEERAEASAKGHGFTRCMDAVIDFDKPLIAAVNGMGVGLGLTVLAHCDLVVMAESARLKAPFTELGVAPEAASSLIFPQLLGWQRASWILYSSEWIDAATALEWGLAFKVVPGADLRDEALALAEVFASKPLISLKATKSAMVGARKDAIAAARRREDDLFKVLTGAAANAGALAAFLGTDGSDGTGSTDTS